MRRRDGAGGRAGKSAPQSPGPELLGGAPAPVLRARARSRRRGGRGTGRALTRLVPSRGHQAPAGSAVTVAPGDVDGVNAFLLTYAAQSAGFNLTCAPAGGPLAAAAR